jgi:hypothetical protein
MLGVVLSASPVHGTLVIAVPNQAGLFVVADRLRHSKERGYEDDTHKLLPIGQHAVAALTGTVGMVETTPVNGKPVVREKFFATDLVREYFTARDPGTANWRAFETYMRDSVDAYLRNVSSLQLPSTPGAQLLQVAILWVEPPDLFHSFVLRIRYSLAETRLAVFSGGTDRQRWSAADSVRVLYLGSAELFLELKEGRDSRFNGLREHPLIRRFFRDPPFISAVTADEAAKVARFLMQQARVLTPLLQPDPDIGAALDEMFLAFPEGTRRRPR